MHGRVRLLYCYATEDEALLEALDRHLSSLKLAGLVENWHQGLIRAGSERQAELTVQLEAANVVLLLVSSDFMASAECQALAAAALVRHGAQKLRLVPVLTRPTYWKESPFGGLAPLPSSGEPVTSWPDHDKAWFDVVQGIRRLVRQFSRSPEQPWAPQNPYRGLESFEPEDEHLFFGRKEVTRRLHYAYAQMNKKDAGVRLLAVLGASGSGKSSVARAGLLPALFREPVPGPLPPRVVIFKPGERPIEALALALLPLAPASARDEALAAARLQELKALLSGREAGQEAEGLRPFARTLSGIEKTGLCVLVDQFEEVYTQQRKDQYARRERDLFVDLLLHAAGDTEGLVSVVVTLRSDFLAATHGHPSLNRAVSTRAVVVEVMSETDIKQAIARPAEFAGAPLLGAMVGLLIEQTRGRAGALPLLEFALQRMWAAQAEGKDPDQTLRDIGGVGGALAGRAQEIYEGLGVEKQQIARRLFLGLVQLGEGTRDTRRRVHISDLIAHGEDGTQLKAIALRFSQPNSRLLTLSFEEGGEVAEVTHEALLEHWQLMREWLDAGREDLRLHRRLAEAAREWERRGRPEGLLWRPPDLDLLRAFHKRADDLTTQETRFLEESDRFERHLRELEVQHIRQARRRIQALAATAIVVALVTSGLGVWALRERNVAETERQSARHRLTQLYVEQGRFEAIQGHWTRAMVYLKEAYWDQEAIGKAERVLLAAVARQTINMRTLLGHAGWISPDGKRLLTTGEDNAARIWDITDGKLLFTLGGHSDPVSEVSFSADGRLIATTSGRKVGLWDSRTGQLRVILAGHSDGVNSAEFSPDSLRVVTTGAAMDSTARLWDSSTGKPLAILVGHNNVVRTAEFSSDGARIVAAGGDMARLWDGRTGQALGALEGYQNIRTARFSPDGARIVTAGDDKTARLWDGQTGKPLATLEGHQDLVGLAEFSPDGTRIVTASDDKTARLWDGQTGKQLATCLGHRDTVLSAAFSPDGTVVATGSRDQEARLWDAQSGLPLAVLQLKDPLIILPSALRGHRTLPRRTRAAGGGARRPPSRAATTPRASSGWHGTRRSPVGRESDFDA